MTQADIFSEYYFEKVGTLGNKQTLKQANMLFGDSINYSKTSPDTIHFKDGSFLKYTMYLGIIV